MFKLFPFGFIILMLASCSTSQDVVQEGLFQKRKYFKKGWFVDKPGTRGLEELEQPFNKDNGSPVHQEAYLEMLPSELSVLEEDDTITLADRELPVLPKETQGRGSEYLVPDEPSTYVGLSSSQVRSMARVSDPQSSYGHAALPLLSTSLAYMVPLMLLALLILAQRLIRPNDNGSVAAMWALFMGILGLVALAMMIS